MNFDPCSVAAGSSVYITEVEDQGTNGLHDNCSHLHGNQITQQQNTLIGKDTSYNAHTPPLPASLRLMSSQTTSQDGLLPSFTGALMDHNVLTVQVFLGSQVQVSLCLP